MEVREPGGHESKRSWSQEVMKLGGYGGHGVRRSWSQEVTNLRGHGARRSRC